MKAIILKPIAWNTNGYIRPSGYPSKSGFVRDYGYGHEEWNNKPNRAWRGFKLFHTESTDRLLQYSSSGELGIVMIAAHDTKQYAIGIATSVFHNDEDELNLISEELNIYDEWQETWEVNLVRQSFANNKEQFLEHWRKNYQWIRWKCPTAQYHHFQNPIPLDPKKISGKQRLITFHGRFQAVYPEQVSAFISNYLPNDHPILEWLSETDFDNGIISGDIKEFRNTQKLHVPTKKTGGTNSPTNRKYQYWVEGNRRVVPRHAWLQAKYVKYLASKGIVAEENKNYIDVQYQLKKKAVFSEIKPTENIETRYAIRIAVGQLLEYRYRLNNSAKLEIVLSSKPFCEEKNFVASLGMLLTYYDDKRNCFVRLLKGS